MPYFLGPAIPTYGIRLATYTSPNLTTPSSSVLPNLHTTVGPASSNQSELMLQSFLKNLLRNSEQVQGVPETQEETDLSGFTARATFPSIGTEIDFKTKA